MLENKTQPNISMEISDGEPLISIIVPVYNVEQYIGRCLRSLIKQSYENIEIILIDDGSEDGSADICEAYARAESRIRVIRQVHKGVSAARNAGLSAANGSYIIFVDSDDWVLQHYVETLYRLMVIHKAQLAMVGKYCKRGPTTNNVFINSPKLYTKTMTAEQTLDNILDEKMYLGYVWNKMFHKAIIDDNNLRFSEEISIWEDLLFCCQYILKISKAVYSNDKLYVYNIRHNSSSNSCEYKALITKLAAAETMLGLCRGKSHSFELRLKVLYASTATHIIFAGLFSKGIYDSKVIRKMLHKIGPVIHDEGITLKLKLYFIGLKCTPKLLYYFYRLMRFVRLRR